jgi:aryl-alcohol dehydrogenase-like predicted oxidoreductase
LVRPERAASRSPRFGHHRAMNARTLGSSGLQVGEIGLGCMPMSWAYVGVATSDDESIRVIHRALDLGVTLLDTADCYGPFTNEDLVGRALEGHRDRAVLATKAGLVVGPSGGYPMQNDARPEHIRDAADGSLRRLRTDAIDLYQLHRVDPDVPLEESWGTMAELVAAGKVRALGLSEANVEQIERAHAIHPVASVQSEFSLWFRERLDDVVPWCAANDVAFIPFSPLGRGFLTGAIVEAKVDPRDFRSTLPRFARVAVEANQAIIRHIRVVADRHDATPGQIALAWVLAQGPHIVPIPGTRRLRHLEENAAAAQIRLTPEDLAELAQLPEVTGPRY